MYSDGEPIQRISLTTSVAIIHQLLEIEKASFSRPLGEKALFDSLRREDCLVLAFFINHNTPLAYAIGQRFYDEWHIMQIATHPHYRNRGFGVALMRQQIQHARSCGDKKVLLEVRRTHDSVVRFYTELGFAIIATRKNYYQHEQEDALIMQILLD